MVMCLWQLFHSSILSFENDFLTCWWTWWNMQDLLLLFCFLNTWLVNAFGVDWYSSKGVYDVVDLTLFIVWSICSRYHGIISLPQAKKTRELQKFHCFGDRFVVLLLRYCNIHQFSGHAQPSLHTCTVTPTCMNVFRLFPPCCRHVDQIFTMVTTVTPRAMHWECAIR